MKKFYFFLTSIFLSFIFYACSGTAVLTGRLPETTNANGFNDARLYEMDFIIKINNVKILNTDSTLAMNEKNGIPAAQKPALLIWTADFLDLPNQRIIEKQETLAAPTEVFNDFENGNRICFWNLSDRLEDTSEIVIRRRFTFKTFDYTPPIDESKIVNDYSLAPDSLYFFYTKSEPWLEQDPAIVKMANGIVSEEKTVLAKTKAIFNWVRGKMKYVYPPEKRGVLEVIKKYEGDCGQYSALFITLCRSVGIPARQQSGFMLDAKQIGYHVWSEVYFKGIGWIPMDCTNSNGFGHLDNKRLISSLGMNIPLKYVPSWANYDEQDAQGNRTDFMQFMTVVKTGISADISTEKRIVRRIDIK